MKEHVTQRVSVTEVFLIPFERRRSPWHTEINEASHAPASRLPPFMATFFFTKKEPEMFWKSAPPFWKCLCVCVFLVFFFHPGAILCEASHCLCNERNATFQTGSAPYYRVYLRPVFFFFFVFPEASSRLRLVTTFTLHLPSREANLKYSHRLLTPTCEPNRTHHLLRQRSALYFGKSQTKKGYP